MNILTDEEIFKCLPAEEDNMEFALPTVTLDDLKCSN